MQRKISRERKIYLSYINPTGNLESRVIDPVAPSMWLSDTLFSTSCCVRVVVRMEGRGGEAGGGEVGSGKRREREKEVGGGGEREWRERKRRETKSDISD
jgi:hypothetical protein